MTCIALVFAIVRSTSLTKKQSKASLALRYAILCDAMPAFCPSRRYEDEHTRIIVQPGALYIAAQHTTLVGTVDPPPSSFSPATRDEVESRNL